MFLLGLVIGILVGMVTLAVFLECAVRSQAKRDRERAEAFDRAISKHMKWSVSKDSDV